MLDKYVLKKMLTVDEDKRNKPYPDDLGKITIGIGHNLTDNGISDEIIDMLYQEDVAYALTMARHLPYYNELDEVRQLVIVDMVFNMGLEKFLGFKRMSAALNVGDYVNASMEMLQSKWARQVGVRASRLAYMMKTGEIHEDYV